MTVPNQFANVTTSIPLSQLDANFNTPITLGNTAIQLGNTVTTLNNMTLANVTVSSGNVTITNVSVTTANVTTANIGTSIITTSETLNYGTANQVQFLNASKVLTGSANLTFDGTTLTPHTLTVSTGVLTVPAGSNTAPSITTSGDTNTGVFFPAADTVAIGTGGTERLRVDSAGNLGLGVTPSAWVSNFKAFQVGTGGTFYGDYNNTTSYFGNNAYFDGTNWKYVSSSYALYAYQDRTAGKHVWAVAASGTAGNNITWTEAMTLDASGNLGIGTTSPNTKLHVVGVVTATQGVTGTPTFGATQSNAQTISNVTFTKLQFNVENWDTASCYDNVTNYRFTPNVAGYYQVSVRTQFTQDSNARTETFVSLYKNGSEHKRITASFGAPANTISSPAGSALVYLNGTTDYIEAYVYYAGSGTSALNVGTELNFFQAVLARAA